MSIQKPGESAPTWWAPRIARFAGIDVRMHITFPALLAALAWAAWQRGGGIDAAISEVIFVLLLFVCVVMHEYGHALTARRFGCETLDITISPIGGIARLRAMPKKPSQELRVALAGPLVNLVIAGVLLVIFATVGVPGVPDIPAALTNSALLDEAVLSQLASALPVRLLVVNVMLAVFNLVPAFPMDGGRVLRALLATRLDYVLATTIAARVGQILALGLGIIGLQTNIILVVIAVFIWFGAGSEAAAVKTQRLMSGLRVRDAMVTSLASLSPRDHLARAVDRLLAGAQQDFPVIDEHRVVVGLLRRAELISGLAQGGPDMAVGEAMSQAERVDIDADLDTVLQASGDAQAGEALIVMDGGRFAGLLTRENIGELLLVRSALEQQSGH